MRRLFIAIVLCALAAVATAPIVADGTDTYIELLRTDLQADKKVLVEYSMELTDEEAGVFWPIYDAYETERVALGDRRLDLIQRYPDAVNVTGPETVRDLSVDWFKLQDDELKLVSKYYKKAEKQLRPRIAVRWVQIEYRIKMLIDLQLASQIPLIAPVPR
jgi:hypothetical protein